MNLSYYTSLGRKLAVVSIVCLSSLSVIAFHSDAIAGKGSSGGRQDAGAGKAHGGSNGNGGHGNSQGRGNELGLRLVLIGAENASDNARDRAAHNSAVILADPIHYDSNGNHIDDGHQLIIVGKE